MKVERLMNDVLRGHTLGCALAEIMAAALAAVEPGVVVRRALRVEGGAVVVDDERFALGSEGRVFVVGGGKAGAPMAVAAHEVLGERVIDGLVIVKDGHAGEARGATGRVDVVEAGHPVPDERGVAAATRIVELLREAREGDLVLVLISGGGSALLTLPTEDLTLRDLRQLTDELLRCGATINEINTLRKHCTQLGGGNLARLAGPASVAALIISDVIDSPLDVIASGPTVPDSTTFADAWRIVERYGLENKISAAVVNRLRSGLERRVRETPKAGELFWRRVHNGVLASNVTAAEVAAGAARARNIEATILTTSLSGEAREVGERMAQAARAVVDKKARHPQLLIAGGETTVKVRGSGLGGRNQELALGAVEGLEDLPGVLLVTLATDGGDGPTDAAGASVTGETNRLARASGLDPQDFLRRNDAYNFFRPLGALLRPGPTLTNVNDLLFILIVPT